MEMGGGRGGQVTAQGCVCGAMDASVVPLLRVAVNGVCQGGVNVISLVAIGLQGLL